MIKQDNRPRPQSSDPRFETLRDLLLEDQPSARKEEEELPQKRRQEKIIFISVNGNNNVVSTEKSRYTAHGYGKKGSFIVFIACCLLFF